MMRKNLIWLGVLLLSNTAVFAQLSASVRFKTLLKDSSAYSRIIDRSNTLFAEAYKIAPVASSDVKAPDLQLTDKLDVLIKQPQERKKLLSYLKTVEVENTSASSQAKAKFYYRLANTFARLRLYPLAMKCFLKTVPKQRMDLAIQPQPIPGIAATEDIDTAAVIPEEYLTINNKDDSLFNASAVAFKPNKVSKAITYQRIHQTFDDGKKAVAYAMLFHVKQPIRGKRKIFVGNNVGHTFITLIKYNSDSTYTSVSFGFYPKKDNLLSATPLIPSTSSVFKDDSGHEWDEVLGKFISKRKFERIQGLILQYSGIKYHLSKNNCTDFGIKAATLAGISMHETYGTWPLGSGNNPGVTGQGIVEHKFTNTASNKADGIFESTLPQAP